MQNRFPRVFMALGLESANSALAGQVKPRILGAHFLWPQGGKSDLLDLSYSGLGISSQGVLDRCKEKDFVEGLLFIPGSEEYRIPLSLRVVSRKASFVGLSIDSTNPDGRIKIDQVLKDQMVGQGIRPENTLALPAAIRPDTWYHGPFDTNILLWKSPEGQVTQAILEYDNSALLWEMQPADPKAKKKLPPQLFSRVIRTASSSEENLGYFSVYQNKNDQKLKLGHGWIERFQRLLIFCFAQDRTAIQTIHQLLQERKVGE